MDKIEKTQVSSMYGMMCDGLAYEDEIEKAVDEFIKVTESDLEELGCSERPTYGEEMLDIMLGTKYTFNAFKGELEDYAEQMKRHREYYGTEFPAERYSPDGKILYTQSLFDTLKDFGFVKFALLGAYDCIALNGFDGSCIDFDYNYRYGSVLQIGKIAYDDEDYCCYFKGYPILGILEESRISDTESKSEGLRRADEEYATLIEDEKKLARFMASLGIYAIIQI